MTIYTITADNHITAHASAAEAHRTPGAAQFQSARQLSKLAAHWPRARLLEVLNSLPGQKPMKRCTDRNSAVKRIWSCIEKLTPHSGPKQPAEVEEPATRVSKRSRKPGTQTPPVAPVAPQAEPPTTPEAPCTARAGSKTALVIALLQRPGGATLVDIMAVTHWQAHSVRGFISGTVGKKLGLTVASHKHPGGERRYSIGQ